MKANKFVRKSLNASSYSKHMIADSSGIVVHGDFVVAVFMLIGSKLKK